MNKFYVTTAIDYVNASPHIGHAYEKIAADILARHHSLRGKDVFFLTGVDEHGSKVEKAAKDAGMSPQDFCNKMSAQFQRAWEKLEIEPNYFIRTTEARHARVVQELFARMKAAGDVYKGSYSGLYCEGCEDYLRERDLDTQQNCPNHKKPPRQLTEENYFFRLTRYKDRLRKWLTENQTAVRPLGRLREVLNQLDDPELGDFSVSRARSSLTWGVPVPDEAEQVIYVWIDALTNYLTGVGYLTDAEHCLRYWPADLHLIGKDIIKFHAIYWPAMLMSAGLSLPKQVFGHGFITVEGQKISKSIGNVIDPNVLSDTYGADAVRFFLFAATPFDQDGDFSRADLIYRVNADLANNLGNLLNRTLTLTERYSNGRVPEMNGKDSEAGRAAAVVAEVDEHISELEFARAIGSIFGLVDDTNRLLNDRKPWTLFKDGKIDEGRAVLYVALEHLRQTALLLYPFTPRLGDGIWRQLGYDTPIKESCRAANFLTEAIPAQQAIRNEGPVFARLDTPVKI